MSPKRASDDNVPARHTTEHKPTGVGVDHGLGAEELSRLRGAIDAIDEGFQVIGFDWRYLYVNASVARHGRRSREELLGRTMQECYPGIEHTEVFQRLEQCMRDRRPGLMENEFSYPDGKQGWFELRIVPCPEGVFVLSVDVTEKKQIEAHLRQGQKLEAIGQLAGGIAHDFNNLLSVILSYSTLLLQELKPSDPMASDLTEIKKAGERAAELTHQLLAFSRRQVVEPRIVDLNAILVDTEKMIRRLVGEDVAITTIARSGLGRVKIDPGHMQQILMNLVVNARDAMPTGGSLTLETDNTVLDEAYARDHPEVKPGPHVMLAVSDTGSGMDRATQERIFEPFFTTKEMGKGTGLGLSTVYGLVKQAGGSIYVYSEVGRGTTFKVYLPRTDEVPFERARPTATAMTRASETVLLVEDDAQLRVLARGVLQRAGYRVLDAPDGGVALQMCKAESGPIHLLLTDVVMPGMSGRELAECLTALRPDMKVLYTSGYTDDAIVRHGILDGRVALLQKPITPSLLLDKVAEVLGTAREIPGNPS